MHITHTHAALTHTPHTHGRHGHTHTVICSGAANEGSEGSAAAPAPSTSARRLTRGGERTTPQMCRIANIGAARRRGHRRAAVQVVIRTRSPRSVRPRARSSQGAMLLPRLPQLDRRWSARKRAPRIATSAVVSQSLWSNRRDAALAVVNNPLIVQLGSGELPAGSYLRLMEDRAVVLDGVQAACAAACRRVRLRHPPAGLRRAQRLRRPASISC